MSTALPLVGTQYRLAAHGYVAYVTGFGASLRVLRFEDRDLIHPFDAGVQRPQMRGALLVPWPNRIADARYEFAGEVHDLPMNEPDRGCASHGFAAWVDFRPVHCDPEHLLLTATIEPQPGYPWRLQIDADFRLTSDGLAQEITVTNGSATAAPVGIGGHPYLVAGDARIGAVDEWQLDLPAKDVLLVSAERLLPTKRVSVSEPGGTPYDFRQRRRIGGAAINNAFTGLARDHLGRARGTIRDTAGHGAQIEWDERCGWVQVYTDDGDDSAGRRAVAIEPMTCPPDAFNSGQNLITLAPGAQTSAGWTIRRVEPLPSGVAQSHSRSTDSPEDSGNGETMERLA